MPYPSLSYAIKESVPDLLITLGREFPDQAELFTTATKMDGVDKHKTGKTALQAKLALAKAGIAGLANNLEPLIADLSKRIRATKRLQFAASIIAALTSGSLFASLAGVGMFGNNTTKMILAACAFLASLLGLAADYLSGGKDINSRELFDQSAKLNRELLSAQSMLSRFEIDGANFAGVDALLDHLDIMAADISDIALKLKLA